MPKEGNSHPGIRGWYSHGVTYSPLLFLALGFPPGISRRVGYPKTKGLGCKHYTSKAKPAPGEEGGLHT